MVGVPTDTPCASPKEAPRWEGGFPQAPGEAKCRFLQRRHKTRAMGRYLRGDPFHFINSLFKSVFAWAMSCAVISSYMWWGHEGGREGGSIADHHVARASLTLRWVQRGCGDLPGVPGAEVGPEPTFPALGP